MTKELQMTEAMLQRALQRSAEYNIPLSEAVDQLVQIDNDRMDDMDFDNHYDHFERDHDELYIPEHDQPEDMNEYPEDDHEPDQFRDDVEADADVLASAGYGTDEDYGCFGGDDY